MGAGRLDVAKAVQAGLAFDKVSVAEPICVGNCVAERQLWSLANSSVTWQAKVAFTDSAVSGSLSSSSISLAAGAVQPLTITIDTSQASKDQWYFGAVTFTDSSGNLPTARMPIAVYAGASTDSYLLSTSGGTLALGGNLAASTVMNNLTNPDSQTLTLQLPSGADFASAPVLSLSNATQSSYSYDSALRKVTWQGQLATATLALASRAALPAGSIAGLSNTVTLSCSAECDDDDLLLDVSGFGLSFAGHDYTQLHVSSNGYLLLGDGNATSPNNVALPSSSLSNAIIAPFWTDLDLAGGAGGGSVMYNALTAGGNDYLVIEWHNAQLYGDTSGKQYSFQVWLQLNSGNVYFNYLALDTLPSSVTVGVQGVNGVLGQSLYYNGQGSAPAAGDALAAAYQAGGQVKLDYNLVAKALTPATTALSLNEDTTVRTDLTQLLPGSNEAVEAKISSIGHDDITAEGLLKLGVDGGIVASSLTVTTAPAHGQLSIDSTGVATYSPDANFNGTDSAAYSATDQAGNVLPGNTLNFTVAPVNDPPVAAISGPASVQSGTLVTLSGAGSSDVDGDSLSYQWRQLSGPVVTLNSSADSVSFTAPSQAGTVVLELKVNDGTVNSAPVSHSVTVTTSSTTTSTSSSGGGGGSLGWGLLLLPLVARWRRRK